MVQLCPRCQRANPHDASFCHFDGCLLRQSAEAAGGAFLREFVFPSGRRCRSFEELVQGTYYEWEDARNLLHDGTFAGFLAGLGRADLARTAREAQAEPDLDIALTNFLAALPAGQVQGPKLGLSPRRLVVGPLRVGDQRAAQVRVSNDGRGILQGKVTVAEGYPWLKIADDADPTTMALRTPREQSVALRIEASGLIVGQNYAGKLVVVSNGGVAEVPIRLDLTAVPFPRPPYQGAQSPHELARKMRDNPHPAVALLESGEIARWFEANGWTYPIAGATAPGLAAVQQFFEELGLAKAPQVQVSQQEFRLAATTPETLDLQVVVRSPARKLVYARAESDSPWLVVKAPGVSGQVQAAIDFAVETGRMPEDKVYTGVLKVVANAGQSFTVRVHVEVQGNKKGWFGGRKSTVTKAPAAAPPVAAAVPVAAPAPLPTWLPAGPPPVPAAGPVSLGRMLAVGALLGLVARVLLMVPADLYARLLSGSRGPAAGSLAAWTQVPSADDGFLRLMALALWWVGAGVGAFLVWRSGGRWIDLLFGLLAGAVAGLAAGATLGCALVAGDSLPRALLRPLEGTGGLGAGMATPLWLLTALACWAVLGGALGLLLGLRGKAGSAALAWLASPLAGVLRGCGLGKVARLFDLRAA